MTEEEARQVAKLHRGITVIRKKRSWAFYAAFHTTWGHKRRYAGKSLQRALERRAQLVSDFAKGTREG